MAMKTIDLEKFEKHAHNVYEATVISSRRARTINDEHKLELGQRLQPVIEKETEDDTIMNQDKLNISLEFEMRDKPTIQAIQEMNEGELEFRYKDKD
jgi:DNA-directed RNA polymerase subunit K/omega